MDGELMLFQSLFKLLHTKGIITDDEHQLISDSLKPGKMMYDTAEAINKVIEKVQELPS